MHEKVTDKLLALDEALRPTLPAFLTLLDMPVEDPQWQALDPPQRRQRMLDAVKRLLLRESQVQPLLVIVENLHWIDTETQAVLDSLIESLPTARLLLLVNYRPEYQHGWGNKTYYTQLRLDPLPPARAEELLQALLGDDASLQPLKQRLIERTEGNPFFLEESVWTLAETKALVGERGAYRMAQALPSIQVPATVQAVLAARIDRLPPEDKRLLQAAAVIGRDVPFPLLQAIAEGPEEALRRSLAHLQAAEFLYELQLFPEHVYTFKHALTQEVAYQSLLQRTRQQYHQQIAQVLERAVSGAATTQPELLAHHYTEAGLSCTSHSLLAAGGPARHRALGQCGSRPTPDHGARAADRLDTPAGSPQSRRDSSTPRPAVGWGSPRCPPPRRPASAAARRPTRSTFSAARPTRLRRKKPVVVEDVVLPEDGADDRAALEAGVHVAPGRQVDVLHLLLVQLLADVVEQAVLVVDVDREVREAGLGHQVGDGELAVTPVLSRSFRRLGMAIRPMPLSRPPPPQPICQS